MIPVMCPPYFIGGGTPKRTLDKIALMIAAVAPTGRALYEIISQWGRYACVAAGQFGPEVNNSSVGNSWRDVPRGVNYNSWAEGRFQAGYRITGPPPPPPAVAAAAGDQHLPYCRRHERSYCR